MHQTLRYRHDLGDRLIFNQPHLDAPQTSSSFQRFPTPTHGNPILFYSILSHRKHADRAPSTPPPPLRQDRLSITSAHSLDHSLKDIPSRRFNLLIPRPRIPDRDLLTPRREALVRFIRELSERHADTAAVLDIRLMFCVVQFR